MTPGTSPLGAAIPWGAITRSAIGNGGVVARPWPNPVIEVTVAIMLDEPSPPIVPLSRPEI